VMANSIPTSEMRFIANTSKETIDISFYTMAHELTHQWFGNQVIPADAFGAIMLSESITEYVSLNIYEHQFGKEKALEFLKMQHNRYLKGRTNETEIEQPLYLVKSGQQYLAYGKGTIAFNTLDYYLGKEILHGILKAFLDAYRFKNAPYPTTIDFLERLKKNTPENLQYLIEDYFETVTFHEAKINSVTTNSNEVTIDFDYSKFRNGSESELLPLNDFIEIGFYDSKGKLIKIETLKVNSINTKKTFILNKEPSKILLDPNRLLIEKNILDNVFNL